VLLRLPSGVAVLAALCLAPAAHAAIRPQVGMKGIRLGDDVSKVRAALGAPDHVIFSNHPIMGRVRTYKYAKVYAQFNGTTRAATVVSVYTRSKAERTSRDVGVGSTRAAVAGGVPNVRCRVEYGLDHCYVGRFTAGRRVTDFRIGSTGRVTSVVVGFVID
jgi:hypothetical protein